MEIHEQFVKIRTTYITDEVKNTTGFRPLSPPSSLVATSEIGAGYSNLPHPRNDNRNDRNAASTDLSTIRSNRSRDGREIRTTIRQYVTSPNGPRELPVISVRVVGDDFAPVVFVYSGKCKSFHTRELFRDIRFPYKPFGYVYLSVVKETIFTFPLAPRPTRSRDRRRMVSTIVHKDTGTLTTTYTAMSDNHRRNRNTEKAFPFVLYFYEIARNKQSVYENRRSLIRTGLDDNRRKYFFETVRYLISKIRYPSVVRETRPRPTRFRFGRQRYFRVSRADFRSRSRAISDSKIDFTFSSPAVGYYCST